MAKDIPGQLSFRDVIREHHIKLKNAAAYIGRLMRRVSFLEGVKLENDLTLSGIENRLTALESPAAKPLADVVMNHSRILSSQEIRIDELEDMVSDIGSSPDSMTSVSMKELQKIAGRVGELKENILGRLENNRLGLELLGRVCKGADVAIELNQKRISALQNSVEQDQKRITSFEGYFNNAVNELNLWREDVGGKLLPLLDLIKEVREANEAAKQVMRDNDRATQLFTLFRTLESRITKCEGELDRLAGLTETHTQLFLNGDEEVLAMKRRIETLEAVLTSPRTYTESWSELEIKKTHPGEP